MDPRTAANQAAFAYAHGQLPAEGLHALDMPPGHLLVRSFLGAPLLDRTGEIRGGLLLGHTQPEQFTQEDEILLAGLAAQAAVALENVR
jgi:GAF domain-containing protein